MCYSTYFQVHILMYFRSNFILFHFILDQPCKHILSVLLFDYSLVESIFTHGSEYFGGMCSWGNSCNASLTHSHPL